MSTRVTFPVQLNLDAAALMGDGLEGTAAQLAGMLQAYFLLAQKELQADGIDADAKVTIRFADWQGPARRTFENSERRRIEKRLHAAVEKATRLRLPPPEPKEDFRIERFEFLGGFGEVVSLLSDFAWNHPDELAKRHAEQWNDRVPGVAWVVTVQKPVTWNRIYGEVLALRRRDFDDGTPYGYFWDGARTETLRGLDRKRLKGLPRLADEEMAAPKSSSTALWRLPAGVRVVFVAAKLPELDLGAYVELGRSFTVRLRLDEAFDQTNPDGPIDVERLRALFHFSVEDIFALVQHFAELAVPLGVLPFVIKKALRGEVLQAFVSDHARQEHARAGQLGQLRPLGPVARQILPADVVTRAEKLSAGSSAPKPAAPQKGKPASVALVPTSTPDSVSPTASWQPGWRGAFLFPLLDDEELRYRVAAANNWSGIDADAAHLISVLDKTNGILSNDRHDAFWKWVHEWENARPEVFDLLLHALDKRGALGRFFDAWLEENLYPVTLRALIRLCVRSRYAQHPKLLAIIHKVEKWEGGLLLHTFDVDRQVIKLFGSDDQSDWIFAAGDSTDPARGVVAETSSYYSEKSKVKKPTKQTLAKLSGPVKKKVADLMARMVCEGNETMTEKELLAQAVKEASQELSLGEKDFENATIRTSLKVLRLERVTNAGVVDTRVHWIPVRQFSGEQWEVSGEATYGPPMLFEAELKRYHVQHLMTALTVLLLVDAILITGVAIVAAGVASVVEVVVAIVISELIYVISNWSEGLTLTGFLMAAWMGELELLGFKGLSGALGLAGKVGLEVSGRVFTRVATQLGAEAGAEALTVKVLRSQASKWILFVLRGGVVGFEFGTLGVFDLLARDVFTMTRCKGLSSSEEYWDRFKMGAIIGAGLELLAVPLLAPIFRPLLAKAGTMIEVVQVLRKSGKSLGEITSTLFEGAEAMQKALGRTLDKPSVTEPLATGFRARMTRTAKSLWKTYSEEYGTRAYKGMLALLDEELSARASLSLRRLLGSRGEQQLDELLTSIARARKIGPSEMLDLLGFLDEQALKQLAENGAIEQLAASEHLLGYLRRDAISGWSLFDRVFARSVGKSEAFVARFAERPAALLDNATGILLRPENRLPPDVVGSLVLKHGVLRDAQVVTLDLLETADVQITTFITNQGPSLPEFTRAFEGFSPPARVYGLTQAKVGSTPAELLAEMTTTKRELSAIGDKMFQSPDEIVRELELLRSKLPPGEALPPSRPAYKEVKQKLRTTEDKDPVTRKPIRAHRGKYEGFVDLRVLRANVEAYRELRRLIRGVNPDLIVGTERGGAFIADVIEHAEPGLAPRIIRPIKTELQTDMYPALRKQLEEQILAGKRVFVFVDAYMGGFNAEYLVDEVFSPLLDKYGSQMPSLRFGSLWIRESWGLEAGANLNRYAAKGPWASRVLGRDVPVPWIFGDDVNLIMGGVENQPIHVYLPDGTIVRSIAPSAGEQTRALVIRLLNGEGLEGLLNVQ